MHIGTFTREGTWRAAAEQLPELARIGITVIEMMPVAEFPGRFGWGYDGVDLFAPSHLYGTPDDLRAFVDRAHSLGLGVILDVVYNHFGPDGNYLGIYSDDYLIRGKGHEWGDVINFDGPNSATSSRIFHHQRPLLDRRISFRRIPFRRDPRDSRRVRGIHHWRSRSRGAQGGGFAFHHSCRRERSAGSKNDAAAE